MPAITEFIANGKSIDEINTIIGSDRLFYQTLEDLIEATSIGQNPLQDLTRVVSMENMLLEILTKIILMHFSLLETILRNLNPQRTMR